MQIDIITTENNKVSPGKFLPSSAIERSCHPDRKFFELSCGVSDLSEIKGEPVLIVGKEYLVGKRRYNLDSGYAIKAVVTPSFVVIPELRKSFGKEINVIKNKEGVGICARWPVIEMITENIEEKAKTESVENYSSILGCRLPD